VKSSTILFFAATICHAFLVGLTCGMVLIAGYLLWVVPLSIANSSIFGYFCFRWALDNYRRELSVVPEHTKEDSE
jgi:hypothetical protein